MPFPPAPLVVVDVDEDVDEVLPPAQ